MLEEQDFQTIGKLFDEKLDKKFEVQEEKITSKFNEMVGIVNDGFTDMQKEFDGLKGEFNGVKEEFKGVGGELNGIKWELNGIKEDIKLRPTLNQIMSWGDKKIISLELDMDKVKYLHQKELSELPSPAEISQVLAEKGFKRKMA